MATYNAETQIVHIPYVNVDGVFYSVEMELKAISPAILFDLKDYTIVEAINAGTIETRSPD